MDKVAIKGTIKTVLIILFAILLGTISKKYDIHLIIPIILFTLTVIIIYKMSRD